MRILGTAQLWNLIMTSLISMVPVLELRGAIPVGVASGLPVGTATLAAIIGNMIPIPFIIIFTRKIFDWLRRKSDFLDSIVRKFENKAESKSGLIEKYKWFGLVILVAIPLPGTGAWTGALVAAMMDMRLKRAFPAIFLGVLIAGVIVAYATYGVVILI
ncbi:MAG: small multi-drug export protein [Eubacteriaceae bacterium]|nr:small multi-drug export protein [Eubacteriaceae bacterium]